VCGASVDGEDVLVGTSTVTTRLLLRTAAERGGEAAVERALGRVGLTDSRAQLHSIRGRVSYAVKLALFDAVAEEVGDPRIGLSLGSAAMTDPALEPIRALIRALGSPAAVLRHASLVSTRNDSTTVFRCTHLGNDSAELRRSLLPPHHPNRVDCDYNISLLTQTPVLFGLPPARVEHPACQVDGAPECEYTITWRHSGAATRWGRPIRRRPGDLAEAAADGSDAAARSDERLRSLQQAVSDLVGGGALEATLDRVTEHANRAVHAPGHLLDVRLPGGVRHVRARGLGNLVLEALGDARLEPGSRQVGGVQVVAVPVATATRTYGVLALAAWPGQAFFREDVELLAAYAGHAAAAIEMSALLGEAREQEETARLLLTVARSLAGPKTGRAICQSVAEAVPGLCGADRAAVALWDPATGSVRTAGLSGQSPELAERASAFVVTPSESPELRRLIAFGRPMLIDRSCSEWAQRALDDFGITATALVPIKAGDRLLGCVIAHWVTSPPPDDLREALAERLWGLAGLAGVALDNTRLAEEIRHQSTHDTLTGLPNRALFHAQLQAMVGAPESCDATTAVLFGNVSRLKRVNDSLGHAAGDEILLEVSRRLRSALREQDTVARYGGDEFAVLLPGAGEREAEDVLARISAALSPPVQVAGEEEIFVGLSLGVAVVEAARLRGVDDRWEMARDLVERARQDMNRRHAQVLGHPEGAERSADRLRLETELHGAVARGELRVHFQPQVDVASGCIVAVEALARWQHPTLGMVPPDVFIPLAEDGGLMRGIGEHVLREACRTVAAWREDGLHLELAVNVSAVQLTDPDFAGLVHRVLTEAGLAAGLLTLEVTEGQMVSEIAAEYGHLRRLRGLGIGISMDDFGTGYSSLTQLHRLPVTEMKVDRAFTAQLADAGSSMLAGVVGLGRGLGLRVVAEGVETAAQLQALRNVGCERAQGYLLGRPTEAATLRRELLRSGTERPRPVS
jgi:diguanylate cyclase (GGDEF)-like protein